VLLRRIVRENIGSALVLEDDADWDVNVKAQMLEFARGTRFVLDQEQKFTISPYGDGWDILWVGHCGAKNRQGEDQRYWVAHNDPTAVPPSQWGYWRRQPNLTPSALNGTFTRVVFVPSNGLCTWGYAISQQGARRFLRDQSEVQAKPSDRALNRMCIEVGGTCIAPYPPLIGTHRPAGLASKGSDRVDMGAQTLEKGVTGQIVFSTRLNFPPLLEKTGEIWSQWPEQTMLKNIPVDSLAVIPKGQGVVIKQAEYIYAKAG
jgi:hypothetical protein